MLLLRVNANNKTLYINADNIESIEPITGGKGSYITFISDNNLRCDETQQELVDEIKRKL